MVDSKNIVIAVIVIFVVGILGVLVFTGLGSGPEGKVDTELGYIELQTPQNGVFVGGMNTTSNKFFSEAEFRALLAQFPKDAIVHFENGTFDPNTSADTYKYSNSGDINVGDALTKMDNNPHWTIPSQEDVKK